MTDMLTVYKHLLPKSRAWNITYTKPLRHLFEGLAWLPQQIRDYFDSVWLDRFAATTQNLARQERMWGLPDVAGLTEAQRRTRLAARKAEIGGQGPDYIQGVLQAHGFNVYVHPWFDTPPVVPPVPPVVRDPRLYLEATSFALLYTVACDEPTAICDEPTAVCDDPANAPGYLLVNKITFAQPDFLTSCDEPIMACDEPEASCDAFDKFIWIRKIYYVPDDPALWRGFAYVGGETFPEMATVPGSRRDEFEDLCLRLFPERLWLGMLISYN